VAGTLAGLVFPAGAVALPSVAVRAVTAPLADQGPHRGVTVTAGCPSGTLVGGGSYLRSAADPATLPTNGLVLGGTSPSVGTSPVDLPPADGATDPSHWATVANFTGVSESGDQAATFALCATRGPAHTVIRAATTTGANAAQQVSPPTTTTATCPAGSRLIGGGAVTSTPDQVNDGATMGNNGNLKPLASYPSDAGGAAAADGSTTATSWTAYGSAGITSAGDTVTAYALCSTDPATPPVAVARADVPGPDAQTGTTLIRSAATCPTGTRLFGGGYSVEETVGPAGGLQPQQGYHMRGSYPAVDATGSTEAADGATDPTTWATLLQAGGQNLATGDHMSLHAYAMCATAPPPPDTADLSVTLASAPDPVVAGQPLTYTATVANAGPAPAAGVAATLTLPTGPALVSATAVPGSCLPAAVSLTCSVGDLAPGASATITVTVTPGQAGTLAATARVAGSSTDADPANDTAQTATTVVAAAGPPAKAAPTLAVEATGSGPVGSVTTARATLAGGAVVTGTIAFDVYGPADPACANSLAASTAPVSGNGIYVSAPFTATAPGTYRWVARYSGDAANDPAGPTACGDPAAALAISPPTPGPPADSTPTPAPTITAVPVPPGLTLLTAKADRRGRIALTLTVRGPGRLGALATTRVAARTGRGKTTVVRYGTRTAAPRAAGRLALAITPDTAARALRRRHTRLRVTVAVTFTPPAGKPTARTTTVTVTGAKDCPC
jgi:uncharacterized repeat protein (TIGR01451 family)